MKEWEITMGLLLRVHFPKMLKIISNIKSEITLMKLCTSTNTILSTHTRYGCVTPSCFSHTK